MNYQRIHDAIIDRARNRTLQGYREKHHVIPRCLGGTNQNTNLVNLTAREHFIVHKLLCEIYPNESKLFFAYRMMAYMTRSKDNIRDYYISSREFNRLRILAREQMIILAKRRPHRPLSRATLDKMAATRKQNGYRHSNETKKKMSIAKLGQKYTDTHRKNLSLALTGNPNVTGKASTPEKEMERRRKIKESWILRKGGQHD